MDPTLHDILDTGERSGYTPLEMADAVKSWRNGAAKDIWGAESDPEDLRIEATRQLDADAAGALDKLKSHEYVSRLKDYFKGAEGEGNAFHEAMSEANFDPNALQVPEDVAPEKNWKGFAQGISGVLHSNEFNLPESGRDATYGGKISSGDTPLAHYDTLHTGDGTKAVIRFEGGEDQSPKTLDDMLAAKRAQLEGMRSGVPTSTRLRLRNEISDLEERRQKTGIKPLTVDLPEFTKQDVQERIDRNHDKIASSTEALKLANEQMEASKTSQSPDAPDMAMGAQAQMQSAKSAIDEARQENMRLAREGVRFLQGEAVRTEILKDENRSRIPNQGLMGDVARGAAGLAIDTGTAYQAAKQAFTPGAPPLSAPSPELKASMEARNELQNVLPGDVPRHLEGGVQNDILTGAAESLPITAAILATGGASAALTESAGAFAPLIPMYATSYGQKFTEQHQQADQLDEQAQAQEQAGNHPEAVKLAQDARTLRENANVAAHVNGAIQTASEMMFEGHAPFRKGVTGGVKRALATVIQEGPVEEGFGQLASNLTEPLTSGGVNHPGLFENMPQSMGAGMLSAAPFGGVVAFRSDHARARATVTDYLRAAKTMPADHPDLPAMQAKALEAAQFLAPNTPAGKASAAAIVDPNLPDAARQAVANASDLELAAQRLARAAQGAPEQSAAAKAPEAAPVAPTSETEPAAQDEEQAQRAAVPLTYSDEEGDAIYQNGAWTLPDGTPAPNAWPLEVLRQQYVKTGELPEGMQAAEPANEPAISAPPASVEAPATDTTTQDQPKTVAAAIMDAGAHLTGPASSGVKAQVKLLDGSVHDVSPIGGILTYPEIMLADGNLTDAGAVSEVIDKSLGTTLWSKPTQQSPAAPAAVIEPTTGEQNNASQIQSTEPLGQQPVGTPSARGEGSQGVEPSDEGQAPSGTSQEVVPPAATEPPAQPKPTRTGPQDAISKAMRSREFREHHTVASDIISQMQGEHAQALSPPKLVATKEKGKPAKLQLAPEYRVAEWNWYIPLLEDPEARKIVHSAIFGGAEEPGEGAKPGDFDMVASHFGMTGDELGPQLVKAAEDRVQIAKELAEGKGLTKEEQIMADMERRQIEKEKAEENGPNPLMPFSSSEAADKPERVISRGASKEVVASVIDSLKKLLPNLANVWTGTRAELEKHLASNAQFRWQWKRSWNFSHPSATDQMANEAFDEMLRHGLDHKEGFTFHKQTYLINDQVAVRESDGTSAEAVRRVLIHEDAHEALNHMRERDAKVETAWQGFRDAIGTDELDALAKSKYPWLTGWREDAGKHDELADEWFAARIADIEKRGQPEPDSLVGRFIKFLQDVVKRFTGEKETPTNQALLEFIDAARAARFRERAEANANGLRGPATNAQGNIPASEIFGKEQFSATTPEGETPKSSPLDDGSTPERADIYKSYEADPNVHPSLRKFAQFLGNPTTNSRLKQALRPMVEYARSRLGGIWGDAPEVTPENTERAWDFVRQMLSNKDFIADYQAEFQQDWADRDEVGRVMHEGDAAGAVLQMEVMDYAVRLAFETGDTSIMSLLYRSANDMILADYQTMASAARALQVRSAAVRHTGAWTALRQAYAGRQEAAGEKVGKDNLPELENSVDPTQNLELGKEVTTAIADKLETSVAGNDVTDAVLNAPTEYDIENYWPRVLNAYEGEERTNLHEFWQTLMQFNKDLQIIEALESEGQSQVQASMAEDVERYRGKLETLKAEAATRKARLLELLGKLTKDETSGESKAKRKSITGSKKVQKAIKALSATEQAKKMLARFENRNKTIKRIKPGWKKAFDSQVKEPKSKEDFMKSVQAEGVTEQTSVRLFDLSNKIHAEREAAKASKPATTAKAAPTAEEEAQRIIENALKEPAQAKAKSDLQALRQQYMQGKINEQAFRDQARALGITPETLETLVDVTQRQIQERADAKTAKEAQQKATEADRKMEDAIKAYTKGVTGTYQQSKTEKRAALKKALANKEITQAEHDDMLKKLGLQEKQRLTDVRAFISSVAQIILRASIAQQEDPAWKRETITQAFIERGMTPLQAKDAAQKLAGIVDKALREGQAKAAMKALNVLKEQKKVNPNKVDFKKIAEAIRTRGADPLNPNPMVKALAEQAGFKDLTPEQFRQLAKLDHAINTGGIVEAAKAYVQMERIMSSLRPNKTWGPIMAASWTFNALSTLGVMSLNWISPIYAHVTRVATDLAGLMGDVLLGKTKATDAPLLFAHILGNAVTAFATFKAEAQFAFKNDTYTNKVSEMLAHAHTMWREFHDAAQVIKNGTPAEKIKALPKFLATSSDYMRRIMSVADQAWGGVLQQYIIRNEAMRTLTQRAGLNAHAAATVLHSAANTGQAAMAKHLAAGNDAAESKLVGKAAMQQALSDAVSTLTKDATAGRSLLTTGIKDANMELGNRAPEQGGRYDAINGIFELFKTVSNTIIKKYGLPGRALVGFISVGANVLNRSTYFSPVGLARVLYKLKGDPVKTAKLYEETMGTEGQIRARAIEAIVGTVVTALLLMLRKDSDDENATGFVFTGNGPSDKGVKAAWEKRGHEPGRLEWVNHGKVIAAISYTRGGFERLAFPLTFVGALDDMALDGKKAQKKNANWTMNYLGTVLGNFTNQARFFGLKNLYTSTPTATSPAALAGGITYTAAPLIPWSGLLKSTAALVTGPQDKTTAQAAILANLPIAPFFTGHPALNYLGDPVGGPTDTYNTLANRAMFAGAPLYVGGDSRGRNADIYKLILEKGASPSIPARGTLEATNGFITDSQWRRYVTTRGQYITEAIRKGKMKIENMSREDAHDAIEDLTRAATKKTKKEMGLK